MSALVVVVAPGNLYYIQKSFGPLPSPHPAVCDPKSDSGKYIAWLPLSTIYHHGLSVIELEG